MITFDTSTIVQGKPLGQNLDEWVYNGLDAALTLEIKQVLAPKLDDISGAVYERSLNHIAPALDMMLRGIKVDVLERANVQAILNNRRDRLVHIFSRYAEAWGLPGANYRSLLNLRQLFYEKLMLPPVVKSFKGVRRETFNREAMEKLEQYYHAVPLIKVILALRDIDKLLSVLFVNVDSDGRMRTSYNIGGTNTFRWSSSESAFDAGTNLQNITDTLRSIFIADRGKKLGYADLEQAESRAVGLYAYAATGRSAYLDACESGDLHTAVTQMVWPELFKSGGNAKEIAEQKYYRDFSYRDMAKRLGHGTNYGGSAFTLANTLKIDKSIVEDFQRAYHKAFPELQMWHGWVSRELVTKGYLISALGYRRHFFGRHDENTIRAAIAYGPQSLVGTLLNEGMFRVWKNITNVELLAQIHDAILFQYDEQDEATVLPLVLNALRIPVTLKDRTITIPTEVLVGWNWRKFDPKDPAKNPNGILKWKGQDARRRHYTSDMDRMLHGVHVEQTQPTHFS